jgi:hypothetical protein
MVKKQKVVFPALGADHPVPVFEAPVRAPEESEPAYQERLAFYAARACIVARVRLVPREEVRQWELRVRKVVAEEQRRAHDAPGTYEGWSEDSADALIELNKEIVTRACAAVEGLQIGEHDLEDRSIAPEQRMRLVLGANLLAAIADACMLGQYPRPRQLDSSGS